MYARLITAQVQPDKMAEFPTRFSNMLLSDISRERGFKSIYLMKDDAQSRVVALVLWETEADAIQSIEGYMQDRLPKMADILVSRPTAETLEVILRA